MYYICICVLYICVRMRVLYKYICIIYVYAYYIYALLYICVRMRVLYKYMCIIYVYALLYIIYVLNMYMRLRARIGCLSKCKGIRKTELFCTKDVQWWSIKIEEYVGMES